MATIGVFKSLILNLALGNETMEVIKAARSVDGEGGDRITVREAIQISAELISHLQELTGESLAVIDLREVPTREELKQLLDANNIHYVE
jgi:hypothetical protein